MRKSTKEAHKKNDYSASGSGKLATAKILCDLDWMLKRLNKGCGLIGFPSIYDIPSLVLHFIYSEHHSLCSRVLMTIRT